ncbi:TPA: hypothetical protein UN285_000308 [Stenotrophomonas maltophilia]|jgi:hypothetical protein|uniref:hypothetical protein n=1 Tax=Stenotrophomonas TaxID=40323 RepID=UPI0013042F9D|nr:MULTISPECIES: hypothetical protein [Stenotrophomonas]MCV4212555.1 hypothetical protein [Pseudomonas cichorii]MBH1426216.1 hypothetical protein [Stenotrophomonas maltophilia]MBH1597361.1 hypothetical protein [Stenotrophomonas maltophilia]MBN5084736.1 hypothetical protein [Stenotrophomonas maltophilia]MBS6053502.1 hypothetical protein [Stenotrophomonas maltophilia]
MRRLLLCLLALGMHLPSATARGRTPEDVVSHHLQAMQERYDLALQTLVQQREADQTGTTDIPVDAPPMAVLLATWTRNIERHVDPVDGVDSPHLAWALQVLANSRCQPNRSEVWHSLTEDMRVADVYFTCRVGDIERLRHLSEATVFDDSEQSDQRFWKAYLSVLRDGPFHEISGTTRLVSTAREPDWHSEESVHPNDDVSRTRVETDIHDVLVEALIAQPRRLDHAGTHDAIAQMTGIVECDDLLQQHRRCVARIAPQELKGVSDLASTLSKRRQQIPEAELLRQCMAFRPRMQALWTRECQ